jgi:GTP-binding protein LepA
MDLAHIRNFSIIAHIDHGKSTLADRMLEVTHTIEARKMRDQVLDSMELERERGITIKMQPVRMNHKVDGVDYVLNLIDTPGHIDFSYEVSRSLKAVEGSILLVDCTQGVQAQTLTTLHMAQESGLTIIPVLSKVDSPLARKDEVREEIIQVLKCDPGDIKEVSGKTGEGVLNLLTDIVKTVPAPTVQYTGPQDVRALIFDFEYSNHQGVILYTRILDGVIKKGDQMVFVESKEKFFVHEIGVFRPGKIEVGELSCGEIGYIVTGIKQPGIARVGDTVTLFKKPLPAFPGYLEPRPLVFASLYLESQDDFTLLKSSIMRLKLSDSSFTFEEESSGALGRGFRCGFLGMLHLEIITERLRREFNLELIVTTPSIHYDIEYKNGKTERVYSPVHFPDHGNYVKCFEPWTNMQIITPIEYISPIMQLLYEHEAETGDTEVFGDNRMAVHVKMPLRELMRNFFDELKSATSGYASVSYELAEMREAFVERIDILVAEELVPAFSRVVSTRRVQEECEDAVEKLYKLLPQELFVVKIQARAHGKIVSSRTLKALRKDVTGYLYGGDITRKMKLLEKQKKGKKKMLGRGKVHIEHGVFMKMMKQE